MLELNIKCESPDEARVYLNAQQYLNLLSDFAEAIRLSKKHGTYKDVLNKVDLFYPEICKAVENSLGAY